MNKVKGELQEKLCNEIYISTGEYCEEKKDKK